MSRVALGPFVVDRLLGRGGMSEVWAAVHADDDVPVAIKVLTGERARRPHALRQFRVEARAVARLDHPHIVGVHDVGEVDGAAAEASGGALALGAPYLVMDVLPGGSLWSYRGRLGWSDLRGLIVVLLDALGHAHARGVIHRDLKPSNVLLSAERRAVLSDFGLAMFPERETDDMVRAGTPSYMAPEQLENRWRDFGPWTDLFGFGALVWTLVTGTPPFRRSGFEDLQEIRAQSRPPALAPLQPVPRGLEGWLRRLLAWELEARFQCAADAKWALEQIEPDDVPVMDLVPLVEPDDLGLEITVLRASLAGPQFPAAVRVGRADDPPPVPLDWRGPRPLRRLHLRGSGLGLLGARALPAIGRDAERDVLWNALVAVHRAPKARAVLLEGPAGTGKTHLARWLCEVAHEEGAASAWWVSHPRDAPGGLGSLLRTHFRAEGLADELAEARVYEAGASYGTRDLADLAVLSDLVSAWETETAATAGAPARLAAVARHLRAVSARRPLIVVVDDGERATDALLFVRWVLASRDVEPCAVLFVVASQDEASARSRSGGSLLAAIAELEGVDRVHVDPLGDDQQMQLVRELLGLEGELARRITARTGGNPAFAVALVEDWVARGVLVRAEGGFRLREGAVANLPDDLYALWQNDLQLALAGVADGVWVGLEVAAVLGMRVEVEEWLAACARLAGAAADQDAIERLLARRLLRGARPRESFRFAHPMVRESLLRRAEDGGRLQDEHEVVLAFLDGRSVDDRRLARHLLAVHRPGEAVGRLVGAARRQLTVGNLHGALDLCDQADAALAEAGLDGAPRREVLLERARALFALGRLDEAEVAALGLAGDAGATVQHRCEARIVLAGVTILRGHPADVRVPLAEVVAAGREIHALDTVARALATRARAELAGDAAEDALGYATEGRRLAHERGDAITFAEATHHLARALTVLGHPRDAVKILNEALGTEHPCARAELLCLLGDLLRRHGGDDGRGDPAAARASYEEAADLLDRIGSLVVVVPRARLAVLLLAEGAYPEAWRVGERCRREALLHGRPPLELEVHVILLAAALGLEDRAGAEEQAARILSLTADGVRCAPEVRERAEEAARGIAAGGDGALAEAIRRALAATPA